MRAPLISALERYMLRSFLSYAFILSTLFVAGCIDDGVNIDNVNIVTISLDNKYKATAKSINSTDKLQVTIESSEESNKLLNTVINVPMGYHSPIISMSWANSTTLHLTIDHDFGDGNLVYEYKIGNNELSLL